MREGKTKPPVFLEKTGGFMLWSKAFDAVMVAVEEEGADVNEVHEVVFRAPKTESVLLPPN